MRISLEWLNRLLAAPAEPRALAERLTMAGFPVVSLTPVPGTVGESPDLALEVEVTANRPDLQCHLGVAQEAAGLIGTTVRWSAPALPAASPDTVAVAVEAPDLCPLYTARVVRGVRVGPSPRWLARLLEAAGQRSVDNVVDVTNYVLLELGQPLHAFDLARLRGQALVARRGTGETMTSLDGTRITARADDLWIADAERPVALAGVMGGLDSEVGTATRDVVLESAVFAPLAIRATSRAHQIRSEASFRFERFVDPTRVRSASDLAAAMLVELCGATAVGPIAEAGPGVSAPRLEVEIRTARVESVFGAAVPVTEVRSILGSLGFAERAATLDGATRWEVPSWRPDVAAEIDLIEEVARRAGYDRVPDDVRIPVRPLAQDPRRRAFRRLRDALVAAGLRECCTAPFVGEGPLDIALLRDAPGLRLENPMRSEENLLRRSVLGPLLAVAKGNQDRGVGGVRLFEIAPVYLRGVPSADDVAEVDEMLLAGGVLAGTYLDAKGCVDAALEALGLDCARVAFERASPTPLRRDRGARVVLDGVTVGHLGELSPRAARRVGLSGDWVVFEVRADALCAAAVLDAPYRPVPRFPAVERDLAWVVDEPVTWARIESAVRAAAGAVLASVRPFDVFRGPQVGAARKSIALRLELRAADRTLTGEEAEACVLAVVRALEAETGGHLRS